MTLGQNFPTGNVPVQFCVQQAAGWIKRFDPPVQAPLKYDLAVNLKTAWALGLTIPESFLLHADEVIE